MKTTTSISIALFILALMSCNKKEKSDATGVFEAVETIVSSEATGRLLELNLNEGEELKKGQIVGYIDSTQAYLNKLQLRQQQKAILSAKPEIQTQLEALRKELQAAESDQSRMTNLVGGDVASKKQLDDANTRVEVLKSKIAAQESALAINSTNISENAATLDLQLAQAEQALSKCRIRNPIQGRVLVKYAEVNEMTAAGKALYKIADLSTMILRTYVTGDQLKTLKLNQEVKIRLDGQKESSQELSGKITWISDKGEFTPKTIQTRDERANTVYALKILVKNSGELKLGMYAEVLF